MQKIFLTCMFLFTLSFYILPFAEANICVKHGAVGEEVKEAQRLLMEHNFLTQHDIDGICGAKTTLAIFAFQRANALLSDGICGEETWKILKQGGKKADQGDFLKFQGKPIKVFATAYSAYDQGNSSYTATGTLVRKGEIAVDPHFIPLGTKVFIEGYGEAIAEDTGGLIKGNIVDLGFDSHEEALAFGTKEVNLYILDMP